jgi:hypothetical protein
MRISPIVSRQQRLPGLVRQDPRGGVVASVPSCLFPLRTAEARSEYDTLAQLLSHAGRLTVDGYRVLSEYALQFDLLHLSLAEGLPVRPSRLDQLRRARKALKLRELDRRALPQVQLPVNKFSLAGFATRNR